MIISSDYLKNLSMPKLLEIRKNKISCIFIFAQLYVEFHLSVIDFSSDRVQLRISKLVSLIENYWRGNTSILLQMSLCSLKIHITLENFS